MEKHHTVFPQKWFWLGFIWWMLVQMVSSQTSTPVSSSSSPPSSPSLPSPSPPAMREHKVHNIMLYPEKHSWCKATPIKQVVTHPGCRSIDMENNICIGACFSFSVPRTIPETPGDDQLYYCDSCQPNIVSWTTVLLECPNTPTREPISKMVEVISNCSCNTFRNIEMYENQVNMEDGDDDDDPSDLQGGTENKVDEEEEEEDNSLPEIHDFINRHENLKLKPMLTPMVIDALSGSKSNAKAVTVMPSTVNQSTIAPDGKSEVSQSENSSSNDVTPLPLLVNKILNSDQMLQFQDLSAELDDADLEDEEVEEEEP